MLHARNDPIAMACPVQAATTGLGNDSSRCESSKPALSMSIEACTSPDLNTLRSNPPLNTRSLPAITTAPASSLSAWSSAVLIAASMSGPRALTLPSSMVIIAIDSSRW